MRLLAAFALATALLGCAAPQPPSTASGKPEVTIRQASPESVKAAIVNGMLNRGYRITRDTQFELSFDRPVDNVLAAALLGSRYDAIPNARVTFQIAHLAPDVRVVADMAIITNPGSSFERRTDVSAGAEAPKIQEFLDQIAASVRPVPSPQSAKPSPTRPAAKRS